MEFRVLGQLEAVRDGERRALGSFRQRSVLALLVIHANQVVSTDRIIDELWGGELGPDRQNALWVHISNLRSALEPDRVKRSEGTIVLTRSPGYVLQVEPDEVDSWRFERLLEEGRSLVDTDPAAAAMAVADGLALWRGRPFEDFAYESFAEAETARLDELRLEAVELRIDADLRCGMAAELVSELEGLARQHPLREHITALLMVALHRSGRRAEALRAFRRLRTHLADEVGIDPSAELQALERQILVGDRSLDRGGGQPGGTQTRLAVRGYELRDKIGEGRRGLTYRAYQPILGREVAIKVTRLEVANDPAFIRRFEAEAELVARLEHPHIVPLYDYWREPDAAYLVTRLFRRGSLADAVRAGPLAPTTAAQLVTDLGSALSLAHRHGVVHGDVTPNNVLLDDDQRGYLADFGIAITIGHGEVPGPDPSDAPSTFGSNEWLLAPEQRAGAAPTPASDVYGLASVLAYSLTGGGARDLDGAICGLAGPVAAVIARATGVDPASRTVDASAFASEVSSALGTLSDPVASVVVENPYKGLRAFEEADATTFFGRERQIERFVARLGDVGTRGRFLAVVGPSGSGKSSVVHAGLVPALRRDALPGSSEWFVVSMTPGRHPFDALEAALLGIAVKPPPTLLNELTMGPAGIHRAVREVMPDAESPLVLIIDQFEELFTLASDASATAFLDALVTAVTDPQSRARVVITLRADFYDRPLAHRGVGELLRRGTEVITPMAPDELERAIDGPAEQTGVRFEPGLVAEIVADVVDRSGALPLLQYALTELFDHRDGEVIAPQAYLELGGVSGALVRRAEALYGGLDADARSMTRQVFLRLMTLGDGTEVVRRRVLRRELTALGASTVDQVLDTFGRHRLLSFDRDPTTRGPTVEIAHEALLTEWVRLRDWIEDGRDDVRLQRRLATAAAEWEAAARDPAYLLRGSQLEQQTMWAATTDLSIHPDERAFLDASAARLHDERSAEEERRQAEERLRRTSRRRTRQLIGGAVVLALVAALGAFAVVQRNDAGRVAGELSATNKARRLAASAGDVAKHDPDLAMLLALHAIDTSGHAGLTTLPEAETALHWAIQGARLTYPVAGAPVDVRTGPNGSTGVFRLPLSDLVGLARAHLSRTLTTDECEMYAIDPCPTDGEGLASPATAGAREVPAAAPSAPLASDKPLAGTTVTMVGPEATTGGMLAELDRFEAETGIHVAYGFNEDAEAETLKAVDAGTQPDIAIWPQPGEVRSLAAAGELVDLSTYLDVPKVRTSIGDYVADAVSQGSGLFGLPMRLDLKGVVWYPVPEFAQAGYAVPTSWDGLLALTRQMVADGREPWCLGFENGAASGWPGTDWIEALVLRLGGVDAYDRWVDHEVPFDAPVVRQAAGMFGQIAFGDGYVRGGPTSISRRNVRDAFDPLFADPPGCWLHNLSSAVTSGGFPAGAEPGVDADFFMLPPLAGASAPAFGGGVFAAAFSDRPEVREVMRRVLSPDWGSAWASDAHSDFLPATAGFDPERCRSPDGSRQGNDLRVRLCTASRDAIAAGTWRFDASDLMPPEVGAAAFWTGMLDYVDQGPASVDRILAGIEAAWPS